MTASTGGLVGLLLLCAAALLWLFRRPRAGAGAESSANSAVDREALEEAEAEVQDLDAFLSPEDADDDLSDWGPGAPRP